MGEILLRVNQNRSFEQHYPELQSIINKIVLHTKNFEGLLSTVSAYENLKSNSLV